MNYSIYPLLLLSASVLLGKSSCGTSMEENHSLDIFLERRLHEAKIELDRIVMDANGFLVRRSKRDPQRPMITFDKRIENNTDTDGEVYHFHNILVLNSEIIKKIDKQVLQHFVVLCGNCLRIDFKHVTFIEVVKKHSHMFIVIGMDDGILNLFSTHLSEFNSHHHHQHKYTLLQTHPARARDHYPVDGKFFLESDHLFLFVIYGSGSGDPSESILFRLRNSYLDEYENGILTDGSKSVATFNSGLSQIIIIAQAANTNRKISSQVLRFSHSKKKLERIQFLETKRPTSVTHFQAFGGDFVLACEKSSPSTIYWWKGGKFLKWLDLEFMSDNCTFSIEQVNDQTLLLNTLKNEATIYSLGWKYIREVVQVPRPVDQKIINLFVSTGNITRLNIVGTLPRSIRFSIWDLTLIASNFTGDGEGRTAVEDPLMECLSKAKGNLGEIAKRINDTNELANNQLIQLDQNLSFDTIEVLGHNSSVIMRYGSADRVNNVDEKSETETEIDELLVRSTKLIQSLIDRIDVTFKSNLTIRQAKLKLASSLRVNNLDLNPEKFIWLDGEQQLLEKLTANEIKTDELRTKNLSGNRINDFILKPTFNSGHRLFLRNLTCNEIVSKMGRINDIHLEQLLMKHHNGTIHGKKSFKNVEAGHIQNTGTNLQVNNQSFSQGDEVKELPNNIHSSSLKLEDNTIIDNLNVRKINGIDVHKLIDNIAVNDAGNTIGSALIFVNDVRVDLLRGQRISQSINSGRRSPTLSLREASSANERGKGEDDCIIEEDKTGTLAVNHKDSEESGQKSRSILQASYPNHHFGRDIHVKGHIKANELICKNCKIVVQNQSFPISNVEEIFWTYNTKQNITAPTIINSSITANEIIEVTYINEKELDCLLDYSNDRDFKPKLSFKNATVLGDILDSSDLSHGGLKAKELNNSIVRSSATQYIKNRKNFIGGISVNYLKADNIEQNSPPELSSRSMRKSNGETGADDDRPYKFVVEGDLIVKEDLDVIYLNGIDVESRIKLTAYNDENCNFDRVEFKNLKMNNIDTNSLNGKSLEMLINSPKSHSKIHRAYISENIEPLQLLNVTYINDINIHEHLPKVVNTTEKTAIGGKKIFKSNLIIKNNLNAERINGVNITDMYRNALSRSRAQNIRVPATIADHASLKSLNSEKLNGIDASRLIDVSSNESITLNPEVVFRRLTVLGNVTTADSCHISQIDGKLSLKGQIHWQSMHVTGNVSWKEADNPRGTIWTMLNKAVTKDKKHRISGSVVFQKDLTIREVQHTNKKNISKMNLTHIMEDSEEQHTNKKNIISKMNLTYIMEDSLMKNKEDNQVVKGEKIFLNHVSCNFITLTADLLASQINQEHILEFNKTLVRKFSEEIIEGHKYFENGFNTFRLKTRGGVNGVAIDDIVLSESRNLPETVFENLEIIKNLNIQNYNSINFDKFLKERFIISKGTQQVFNGIIYFQNDMILKGESFVGTLNNATIENIVLTKGNSPTDAKVIGGCKAFNNLLKINGEINNRRFNNKDLHRLHKCSAFYDEYSVIEGNIVFENDVTLGNGLWAQPSTIEGVDINFKNAINSFKESTGSKLLDDV